jgi:hypothetical protein
MGARGDVQACDDDSFGKVEMTSMQDLRYPKTFWLIKR